ncbi:MAG: UDP-glucose/GDP-mannose dehydrogenase family protein [Verrucomicrobiales bacterium]|nr:UDP-glucose/GDP-mannose dehydrogenase family protein [Verrucomicrobiales bacterium]
MKTVRISIIGTGYVGLVTGACFAEVGHQVTCVDNDVAKVDILRRGGLPIYEPGLGEIVQRNVAAGRLRFTESTVSGVADSEVVFIAVPTPPLPDGSVDLSFIEKVAREIAACLTTPKIIVDKSTVPVKTGEKVAETIKRYSQSKVEFDVVSNPEFLREGCAVEDLMHPDRIVIGVQNRRPVATMRDIYAPFDAPIVVTDINSAELIKHAANSFLALKISYANALSAICEASGADIQQVVNGIGMDRRIGRAFLNAGLGFGGSCFPKDLSAFIKIAEQLGCPFDLLKEVQAVNRRQMDRFLGKIKDTLWVLKDKRLGVLGLAFKNNTDDIRLSPAIELCTRLQAEGAILRVHDPRAMEKARAELPDAEFVPDMNAVAEGCDALVVATEWEEFKQLDLARARAAMTHPILFDGRNLFDPDEMERFGWVYRSVGR